MVEQIPTTEQWTDDVIDTTVPKEKQAKEAGQSLSAEAITLMEITDSGKDVAGKIKLRDKVEIGELSHNKFEKEKPLTNTERFMADTLRDALLGGDFKKVSSALGALGDNLDSAHRVLSQVRREMENKSTSVQFVTGRDQDGRPHIDLNIYGPKQNIHANMDGVTTSPGWLFGKKAVPQEEFNNYKLRTMK